MNCAVCTKELHVEVDHRDGTMDTSCYECKTGARFMATETKKRTILNGPKTGEVWEDEAR